jgi:hypothetical protein
MNARDWQANKTILSGDINGDDTTNADGLVTNTSNITEPNSQHVVFMQSVNAQTLLDGLYITAGSAYQVDNNSVVCPGNSVADPCGGGLYNRSGSPVLNDVEFIGNRAVAAGGGMWTRVGDPTLTNVTFRANSADDALNSNDGKPLAVGYGGGLYVKEGSNATLTDVKFINNRAEDSGGGMAAEFDSDPVMTGGEFTGNTTNRRHGGAVYSFDRSDPEFTSVTFTNNTAGTDQTSGFGGAVYHQQNSNAVFDTVNFTGNEAYKNGGAAYNTGSSPIFTDVSFVNNLSKDNTVDASRTDSGGAVYNTGSSNPKFTRVTFSGNQAANGGAMLNQGNSTPVLVNVTFENNEGIKNGGAIWNIDSNPVFANAIFYNNTTGGAGGAMYNRSSAPELINTTFANNSAPSGTGGAIYNRSGSAPLIQNSILWGNTAAARSGIEDAGFDGANNIIINNSIVQGVGGSNPQFVNPAGGDLRLSIGSPAINAGDTSALPQDTNDLDGDNNTTEPLPLDLDGEQRLHGSAVDMGAYETVQPVAITLSGLNTTYDGSRQGVTVSTVPPNINVDVTYDGSATKPRDAGSYPVVATVNQTGYTGSKNDTLSIGKATVTATADDKSRTYGNANPNLTISYSGFVAGQGPGDLDTLPTASTAANETSNVRNYTIQVTGGSDNNYRFNRVNGTLEVTKRNLRVTAENQTKTYGNANPAPVLDYTEQDFVNNDDASDINTNPTLSHTAQRYSDVGSYAIEVTGGSDNNYNLVTSNGTLTVEKRELTITARNETRREGEPNPTFSASYTGFVGTDSKGTATSGEPNLSTSAMFSSSPGDYDIVVTKGSLTSTNYSFAFQNGTLKVTDKIIPVISWSTPTDIVYGTPLDATQLNATAADPDTSAEVPGTFNYTPAAGTVLDAGNGQLLEVEFVPDDTVNYETVDTTVQINVLPAPLTITADDQTIVAGEPIPALTYSYSGFVNGDNESVLDVPPSISTTATASSMSGSYVIEIMGADDQNYDITRVNGTLTILPPVPQVNNNGEGLTSNGGAFTLSGKGIPGITIRIYIIVANNSAGDTTDTTGFGTELGTTTVDNDGNWSFSSNEELEPGAYTLTVVAEGQDGLTSNPTTIDLLVEDALSQVFLPTIIR